MKITARFNILVVMLMLSLNFSCSDDFLTAEPEFGLSSETFWETTRDAELGLTGCYDALQENWLYAQRNQNDGALRERECFTDNSMNGFLYQRFNNIKNGTLNADDSGVGAIVTLRPWRALYRAIGRTNVLLANIDRVEGLDDNEKASYKAQAKVIRALMYWNLTNAWDDVPLITQEPDLDVAVTPKSTALQIYNTLLVPDLEEAIALLPDNWQGNDYGKVTSNAARALLARIHLFFYGYHNVAEAAQRAADLTADIIASGQHELFPDYPSLFTPENEDQSEIIWSVRFTSDLGGNNTEGFSFSTNTRPQANNQPLQNFVDAFYCTDGLPIDQSPLYNPDTYWENRDPRWDATIIYDGEQWLENRPPLNIAPGAFRTGYLIDKYVIGNNQGIIAGNGGQDWYIFRYADVLLMRAEALLLTGNNGQEVYDHINAVRGRVDMPAIEDVEGAGLGIAALTDIVRHERRVELGFENTRFVDLKRWGTMAEAYARSADDRKPGGVNPVLSGVAYQGERSVILPLPQSEIDRNSALEQHPAW